MSASLDLPNWLALQKAKNAADGLLLPSSASPTRGIGGNLLIPTPAAARPIWDPDNLIGTSALHDTYASPASANFSPLVERRYASRPLTQAEADRIESGAHDYSLNLFGNLALAEVGGGPRTGPSLDGHVPFPDAAAPPKAFSSRSAFLYNAPQKPPRPFAADYPSGAPSDAAGKLTVDIEGRPLGAAFIAGRSTLGGSDQAVSPAEFNALSEAAIGTVPQAIASRALGSDAGRFTKGIGPDALAEYDILFDRRLPVTSQNIAIGHELGHMVDELAGQIPTAGLSRELSSLYNTMVTGSERSRHLTRPGDIGYSADEAPREQMATAIHVYLTNPNYIKTVAPKTASAIRAAVNNNPRLKNIVQFNTVAGLLASGVGSSLATDE